MKVVKSKCEKGEDMMLVMWIVIAIGMIVIEAVTVQLVSFWFALGAVAAIICELCGLGTIWQCVAFVAVSLVALVATRPFIKKITHNKKIPTNADRLIGQKAIVVEKIDNEREVGSVKINGLVWSARSEKDDAIEVDCLVKVLKIDGVRLIVKPFDENNK